jgi:ABC-type Na+ efflux pump permease subunit
LGETPEYSSSYLDSIRNLSWTTWLIIVFILAFFGINIFVYLAKGTQDISNFFKPFIEAIAKLFGTATGQIVQVSAEGAKSVVNATTNVVDTTASAVDKGLSAVQDVAAPSSGTSIKNTIPQPDVTQANTLNRALNTSAQAKQNTHDYDADEASSNIQNGGPPKSGWCFIGEDRGFRSCAKVGVNDKCMSGDIFPSHEICVNPSLRP